MKGKSLIDEAKKSDTGTRWYDRLKPEDREEVLAAIDQNTKTREVGWLALAEVIQKKYGVTTTASTMSRLGKERARHVPD